MMGLASPVGCQALQTRGSLPPPGRSYSQVHWVSDPTQVMRGVTKIWSCDENPTLKQSLFPTNQLFMGSVMVYRPSFGFIMRAVGALCFTLY